MKLVLGFSLLFSFILCPNLKSQTASDTTTKVVSILPQQSFYLDSRFVANVNGRSRLSIPFCLPDGTIKYFISFAGTESKNEIGSWIGLAGQLTRIIDRTGISAGLIDALVKPTGSSVLDIAILDTASIKNYISFKDKLWKSDPFTSRQNITGGILEIIPKANCEAICFNNPSLKSGVNVKFEISAIVSKLPAKMFAKSVDSASNIVSVTATLADKVVVAKESAALKMSRVADSLEQKQKFVELLQYTNNNLIKNFDDTTAKILNARALILNNKSAKAIPLVIDMAKNNLTANMILAHSYLLNNQYAKAEKIYTKNKNAKFSDGILWEDKVRSDFKAFISYKMFNSYYDNILKKLTK